MRITILPTEWDEHNGLVPIDAQDIDIRATREELQQLAQFLSNCAQKANHPSFDEDTIQFGDSKPKPKTGISLTIGLKKCGAS